MRHFTADELALLAAIHADPRADLPRLVYADWLDDHGEAEQAEFVRLQCQTAREAPAGSPTLYSDRERALLKKHEVRWRGERLKSHQWLPGDLRYRGFARGLPRVDRYTSNHEFELVSLTQTLAHTAPHYQLLVILNVYPGSGFDAGPMFSHPIFRRAAWVHIRALGDPAPDGIGHVEAVLPHAIVEEAVLVFRSRPQTVVRFGPLADEAARLAEQLPNHDRTPLGPTYPASR